MIRISDAITLAYTKLKTRRIRTLVTIIIASLLFGVISLGIIFLQGTVDSIGRFSNGSLSGRFLTRASYRSDIYPGSDALPSSVKDRAQEIYNQTVAAKKAAAQELGVDYDPTSEQKPIIKYDNFERIDSSSPSAIQAFNEYVATLPTAKQMLDELVVPYKPTHVYVETPVSNYDGQLKPISKDKGEVFDRQTTYVEYGSTTDVSMGWEYMDQGITAPFMLTDQQLKSQTNVNDIPVIAPISKVEEALGLKALPKNAPAKDKLDRIVYIKEHAEKATFSVCYRNSVSQSQIDDAISTAKTIEANKSNKDYQKPSLIYGLPTDTGACAPATIVSDTRTAAEKQYAQKMNQFNARFGQEVEPVQQKITFRVVGLSPNGFSMDSMLGISNLVASIAGSTLEGRWVVPQQMFDAMPNKQEYARFYATSTTPASFKNFYFDYSSVIVEFDSAAEAKTFVDKNGCGYDYCDSKKSAMYFGANSVFIDEVRNQVARVLLYITFGVLFVAGLIMVGMTGRVIGDSRRETAVFRAIGAKRNDIRLIYISYTLMLSLIIVLASYTIGLGVAIWVNSLFSPDATVQAHLSYIFADDKLTFGFIGMWPEAFLFLGLLIVLTGIFGMLLPLARNLARSPIKDMRDDT